MRSMSYQLLGLKPETYQRLPFRHHIGALGPTVSSGSSFLSLSTFSPFFFALLLLFSKRMIIDTGHFFIGLIDHNSRKQTATYELNREHKRINSGTII